MNDEIWVFMDCRTENLFRFSAEVLKMAVDLAAGGGMRCIALLLESEGQVVADTGMSVDPPVKAAVALDRCFRSGVHEVLQLRDVALSIWRTDACAAAVTRAVGQRPPRLVLFSRTEFGVETAARAAQSCSAGLISDCAGICLCENSFVATCPSWNGKIMAEITYSQKGITGFATVSRGAGDVADCRDKDDQGKRIATRIKIGNLLPETAPRLLARDTVPQHGKTLETADMVVVGGAGLQNAAGFDRVRELSAALGGVVGATRPPVLQKWVDEERLIGQTGKSVSPKTLISVGTSGAVQYTAGILEADRIIAINRDPEAPVFEVADIGIVADAAVLLPLLTERIKRLSLRKIAETMDNRRADAAHGPGTRIRRLRESYDWSRRKLAEATGCTVEALDDIESGSMEPSVSFLLRLSRAMEIDPDTFLSGTEKRRMRDRRADAFYRRTQNYSYHTYTPEAEQGHLRAFMISIEPGQQHKPVEYKHEGEEFVFVMEGELELTLDGKARQLNPGDTAHFNSEVPHRLKSRSAQITRCLVVLYTP